MRVVPAARPKLSAGFIRAWPPAELREGRTTGGRDDAAETPGAGRSLYLWSDFVRRASYVNSHGRVNPDFLLLNPIESILALLGQTDKLWWSPEADHVGYIDGLYDPQAQQINAVYSDAMKQLTCHRIEYLIADRHYVSPMSIDGAQLVPGEFRFKSSCSRRRSAAAHRCPEDPGFCPGGGLRLCVGRVAYRLHR